MSKNKDEEEPKLDKQKDSILSSRTEQGLQDLKAKYLIDEASEVIALCTHGRILKVSKKGDEDSFVAIKIISKAKAKKTNKSYSVKD